MRKAFLCYSTRDAGFVGTVARRLGQTKVVWDDGSFAAGEDFRAAIRRGLDAARLFVFFASRRSLDSDWCRFELDEADLRRIGGKIDGHLAVLIDPTIRAEDLPAWMRRAKAVTGGRAVQVARDVEHALYALSPPGAGRPFVGRTRLMEEFVNRLSDTPSGGVRVIAASGLDGIGRRSYLDRVCRDALGLRLGPFVQLDESQGLEDVYLKCLGETVDPLPRKQLAAELSAFRRLDVGRQVDEIVNRLLQLCRDQCVPCLVDAGGMLDGAGRYRNQYAQLLDQFAVRNEDAFLAVVHRRAPYLTPLGCSGRVFHQKVPALADGEARLLLRQLCAARHVRLEPVAADELLEFLGGYPPLIHNTAYRASAYGLDVVRADKQSLVSFNVREFAPLIGRQELDEDGWLVLRYLASEQPLPLAAIAVALSRTTNEIAQSIIRLIDLSLVVSYDEVYTVAPPIQNAIHAVKGHLDGRFYAHARDRLTQAFWAGTDAPSIEVIDATVRADLRADRPGSDEFKDLVRVSVVHGLALECYRRKEWGKAVAYARRAEQMDPSRWQPREVYFKALVQLEQWAAAEEKWRQIEREGHRTRFYLRGFLLRRRGRHADALEPFEAALSSGDTGVSVYRDYADSLSRCGRHADALRNIQEALRRSPKNVYVLDLVARIAIEGRQWGDAKQALDDLRRYDHDGRFYHHRASTYWLRTGVPEAALAEAEAGCRSGYAPFEAYAGKIDALIQLRKDAAAEDALKELGDRFGKTRQDVQLGLRCKLLIRQGRWETAKAVWDGLQNKSLPVHLALLAGILDLKGNDPVVPLAEREDAKRQAQTMSDQIDPLPADAGLMIDTPDPAGGDEGVADE